MDCIMCSEDTLDKKQGICQECQQKIFKALGMKVQFLEEEPWVKVTPKEKEPLFEFIQALGQIASNVDCNYFAVEHHSHGTKEVEVVSIEKE